VDFTVRLLKNDLKIRKLNIICHVDKKKLFLSQVEIAEINNDNFLSAGEIPLPTLYFTMALLFFFSGCLWVFILNKSK